MTLVTPTGLTPIETDIIGVNDFLFFDAGAQSATSFTIEAPGDTRLVFTGIGLGGYSGNFPTTGTITGLTQFDLSSGVVESVTWSGFSMAAADFLNWINTSDDAAVADAIFGSADTINGTSFDDILFGYGGVDTIFTNGGNDTVDAGDGNDLVISDGLNTTGSYDGGAGNDRLRALGDGASFQFATLSSFERLELVGQGGDISTFASFFISQMGAGLSNTLEVTGSALIDVVLVSGVGNADLSGWTFVNWTGSDQVLLYGDAGANNFTGTSMSDRLDGFDGADVLRGGDGDDVFYPSGGAVIPDGATDDMFGGGGNDQYAVLEAGDIIHELAGEGTSDYAAVYITYTMVANLENIALYGTAATATGNALGNNIFGNSSVANVLNGVGGNDSLSGGALGDTLIGNIGADGLFGDAGDDILRGGSGGDSLNGGVGVDTATYSSSVARVVVDLATNANSGGEAAGDSLGLVENLIGSAFNDILSGDAENNEFNGGDGDDSLNGAAGADLLLGAAGNDTFEGGAGADMLTGGAGNDTARYLASAAGVTVNLATGAASGGDAAGDTLAQMENLTGSTLSDVLTGSAAANVIIGAAGADAINGGGGSDTLSGSAGADIFVFSTTLGAGNVDAITDFSVPQDNMNIDNAVFAGLAAGALAASAFRIGAAAADASDRIIYNSATGALYFDVDGVGGAAQVQFATLTAGLALTAADFTVI